MDQGGSAVMLTARRPLPFASSSVAVEWGAPRVDKEGGAVTTPRQQYCLAGAKSEGMKDSANLPPSRVREAPRAGTREEARRNARSLPLPPALALVLESLPFVNPPPPPPGQSEESTDRPPFSRDQRVDRTRGRTSPAPAGVPSLSAYRSLCLRAACTNGGRRRARSAVSGVDLVQGSTGGARPRGTPFRSGRTWAWEDRGRGALGTMQTTSEARTLGRGGGRRKRNVLRTWQADDDDGQTGRKGPTAIEARFRLRDGRIPCISGGYVGASSSTDSTGARAVKAGTDQTWLFTASDEDWIEKEVGGGRIRDSGARPWQSCGALASVYSCYVHHEPVVVDAGHPPFQLHRTSPGWTGLDQPERTREACLAKGDGLWAWDARSLSRRSLARVTPSADVDWGARSLSKYHIPQ
ncbi:hypothetical protein CMUS01_08194 [Colletotrichum musicola]|uniref:Uncharacterized protein n=1 Tax=Colletotrichum musicola TaxID=2175873 RepID=A0A8H6KER2_9PEZI|nr:hypothetical protein CMUS01_08194 [Colletotrichum musicola]